MEPSYFLVVGIVNNPFTTIYLEWITPSRGKLLRRFLSAPIDFTWEERVKIMASFGYKEIITGKTGGSRRKFKNVKKI
jgi:hypothetical protein